MSSLWNLPEVWSAYRGAASIEEKMLLLERMATFASIQRSDVLSTVSEPAPSSTPFDDKITVCILCPGHDGGTQDALDSLPPDVSVLIVFDERNGIPKLKIDSGVVCEQINFSWRDDFSAARNAAADHVKRGWIVFIDSDEVLLPNSGDRLLNAARQLSKHPACNNIGISLRIWDGQNGSVARIGRMFRADGNVRYRGEIHEELTCVDGQVVEVNLDCDVVHDGYGGNSGQARAQRNLRILDELIAAGRGQSKEYFFRARDAGQILDEASTIRDLDTAAHADDQVIAFQGSPRNAARRRLVEKALLRGDIVAAQEHLQRLQGGMPKHTVDELKLFVARRELEVQAVNLRSATAAALMSGVEDDGPLMNQIGVLSILLRDYDTVRAMRTGQLGDSPQLEMNELAACFRSEDTSMSSTPGRKYQ